MFQLKLTELLTVRPSKIWKLDLSPLYEFCIKIVIFAILVIIVFIIDSKIVGKISEKSLHTGLVSTSFGGFGSIIYTYLLLY